MINTQKDKAYEKLHEQLSQEYSYSAYAIGMLRGAIGHGNSHIEIVDLQKKRIEGKQLEIVRILRNIKTSQEMIDMLTKLDKKTLIDILDRQP